MINFYMCQVTSKTPAVNGRVYSLISIDMSIVSRIYIKRPTTGSVNTLCRVQPGKLGLLSPKGSHTYVHGGPRIMSIWYDQLWHFFQTTMRCPYMITYWCFPSKQLTVSIKIKVLVSIFVTDRQMLVHVNKRRSMQMTDSTYSAQVFV